MYKDQCTCWICSSTAAIPKRGNLNRHFTTVHANFIRKYPPKSVERKLELERLRKCSTIQQNLFKKSCSKSTLATVASLRVCRTFIQHKKHFTDGAVFKEAFLAAADSLFQNFRNKAEIVNAIDKMQLSRQTVTRRVETMAIDLRSQLNGDFDNCSWFSLQFDESTDSCDMSQLSVFVRLVFPDGTSKEEFVKILPLKERTRGEDIYNIFESFALYGKLPLN